MRDFVKGPVFEQLKTGLVTGFDLVLGRKGIRGRADLSREYDMPKLVVRGHERFIKITGMPMGRYSWEVIRHKIHAGALYVERDAIPGLAGQGEGRGLTNRDFRKVQVTGLGFPARHAAGLLEFRAALGALSSPQPDKVTWKEMWKRLGTSSLIILFEASELDHGPGVRR
jgi:hypothetical protein